MLLARPIETPRLSLRTLEATDVGNAYVEWLRDPEVVRYLEVRFLPPQDAEQIRAFVESANTSASNLLLGIFRKEDDVHIGNIKLGPVVREHGRATVGYLIGDRSSWGRGYASEAIHAVARHAIETMGLKKITAGCYETNVGSSKALLKAGFKYEATIPSDVVHEGCRIATVHYGMIG